jgi:hypothetical protein
MKSGVFQLAGSPPSLIHGLEFCLLTGNIPYAKAQVWQDDIQSFGARCDGTDDSNRALRSLPSGGVLVVSCRASIGPAGIQLERREGVTIQGAQGGGFIALAENVSRTLFAVDTSPGTIPPNRLPPGHR